MQTVHKNLIKILWTHGLLSSDIRELIQSIVRRYKVLPFAHKHGLVFLLISEQTK